MTKKERLVPDKLVKMFPQYTRKQLYLMLFPFWTGVSDRFKRKKSDVSAASITIKGLGRFELKVTSSMKKTAAKFKRRQKRKAKTFQQKKELTTDKLIY